MKPVDDSLVGINAASSLQHVHSGGWRLVASKIYTTYLFEQMESGKQPNHIYLENGHWLMCAEMRQPANNALTINKSLKLAFNNDTMHSPIKSNWCNLQINATLVVQRSWWKYEMSSKKYQHNFITSTSLANCINSKGCLIILKYFSYHELKIT